VVKNIKKVLQQKAKKEKVKITADQSLVEASNLLYEAITADNKPEYVMLRAFQNYFVQDYEEALRDFRLCLSLDPENGDAQFYIAKTMLDMMDVPFYVD